MDRASAGSILEAFDGLTSGIDQLLGRLGEPPHSATDTEEDFDGPEVGPGWSTVLALLGYLPDDPARQRVGELERTRAQTQLLDDLSRSSELLGSAAPLAADAGPTPEAQDAGWLDQLLGLIAGDAGGPGELPAAGATSLWTRLLRVRFRCLGLLDAGPLTAPWTEAELGATCARLGQAIERPVSAAELLHLTGDTDAMLDALRRRDPHGFLVFDPTGSGPAQPDVLRVDDNGTFTNVPGFLPSRVPRRPIPKDARDEEANRLGLRLLQLRLWRAGLYPGPISAATDYRKTPPDAAAVQSLDLLGAALRLAVGDGPERREVLRDNVGRGFWAINLSRLGPCLAALDRSHVEALLAQAALATEARGTMPFRRVLLASRRARTQLAAAREPLRHFLLGEPFGTSQLFVRFAPDGDVVLFAASDVSTDNLRAFEAQVRRLRIGLGATLAVALVAIQLAQNVILLGLGPLGWARLALELAHEIRAVPLLGDALGLDQG